MNAHEFALVQKAHKTPVRLTPAQEAELMDIAARGHEEDDEDETT